MRTDSRLNGFRERSHGKSSGVGDAFCWVWRMCTLCRLRRCVCSTVSICGRCTLGSARVSGPWPVLCTIVIAMVMMISIIVLIRILIFILIGVFTPSLIMAAMMPMTNAAQPWLHARRPTAAWIGPVQADRTTWHRCNPLMHCQHWPGLGANAPNPSQPFGKVATKSR